MLRKLIGVVMVLAMLATVTPAMAADESQVDVYNQQKQLVKSIVFAIGVNQYFVNGQTPGVKMDAAPYIDSDRTFVPIRFLGNALGISNENITWNDRQGRAALQAGSIKAELTIGKKQIVTNGLAKDIDVAPQLQPPGRTFLPARFVCEALGYEVDWQNDKYVLVWPKGQPKPDIEQLKNQIEQVNNTDSPYDIISKNTGAVIQYGVLVFREKGNTSGQEAFFIDKSHKYDYLLNISSYSDESLTAVKEALKVYYPTGYSSAFENLRNTINTGGEVKTIYYDNRYFGVKKFTDGTVIYIGVKGVKY
ncbi:MAG: copper amine oxidase N-terminal domain-containing protein [Gammaproteobacteria bacterium]|nr:copper amine oxidase N-terminal domain-containing protein [Gammaproteobacteria bacterium]